MNFYLEIEINDCARIRTGCQDVGRISQRFTKTDMNASRDAGKKFL